MSDGTSVTITTNKFTCTPGDNPPIYLPGSPEDLVACRKKPAGTASAPAAPAAE